jgi:hypothetical protein
MVEVKQLKFVVFICMRLVYDLTIRVGFLYTTIVQCLVWFL